MQYTGRKALRKVLIFAIIIVTGWLCYAVLLKPYIREKFIGALRKSMPAGYSLTFGYADIGLFPFNAQIDGLELSGKNSDSQNSREIKINSLKISRIGLLEYFLNQRLVIDEIKADSIMVRSTGMLKDRELADASSDGRDTSLKQFEIKSIDISNVSLLHYYGLEDSTQGILVPRIKISARELKFDKEKNRSHAGFLDVEANELSFRNKNGLHKFSASKLHLSGADSCLTIDSLKITPLIKANRLREFAEHEVDIIDMFVPQTKVIAVSLGRLFDTRQITAGGIGLERPRIEIFKDKTLPDNPSPTGFPSEFIAKVSNWFLVDSMSINQGFIKYYELKDKESAPGSIRFENLNASIRGITDTRNNSGGSSITASALLMGKGFLSATIRFPFGFDTDTFTVKGALGNMELGLLNSITVHVASLEIVKGFSEKISFEFSANKYISRGKLYFHYSDLKVSFLEKEKGKKGIIKKIIAAIANMAIRNDNPTKKDFRVGEIQFVREEPKSIFNYWWKSLFSGIRSTVLVRSNKTQ